MPQVSGLSKPDIIIQIEGTGRHIVCCITVNDVLQSHYLVKTFIFNSNARYSYSYFHSACEPFAKDQNARDGTPI